MGTARRARWAASPVSSRRSAPTSRKLGCCRCGPAMPPPSPRHRRSRLFPGRAAGRGAEATGNASLTAASRARRRRSLSASPLSRPARRGDATRPPPCGRGAWRRGACRCCRGDGAALGALQDGRPGGVVGPSPACGASAPSRESFGGAPEVFFWGDVSDNCGQASTQQPRGLVAVKVKPSLAQILVFGERASCEKIKSGVDEERPH